MSGRFRRRVVRREFLRGGLADGIPSSAFPAGQLAKGKRVEMEHTSDPRVAEEIARDHLSEDPRYYDALEKMENTLASRRRKEALMRLSIADRANALSRRSVRLLGFDGKSAVVRFDGRNFVNEVRIAKREEWVASWIRGKPILIIDDDVPAKYRPSLVVHEAVEKYVCEEYGLSDLAEGHEVAEAVEYSWATDKLGKRGYDEYMKIVERIHRKELERLLPTERRKNI